MRTVEKFLVPKTTGKAFRVQKGQLLRISQPEGPQVVDFDAFNAENPKEYLGSSVTRREEGIHVTVDSKLWTCAPWERHMFTIVADTVEHKPCESGARSHDFLMGRCSQVRRRRRWGTVKKSSLIRRVASKLRSFLFLRASVGATELWKSSTMSMISYSFVASILKIWATCNQNSPV